MNTVLIVDDEPYVLEGLRIMIDWEKYGFEVCGEAIDGMEAYTLIESLKPDLVVTDIHMPHLDGLSLIHKSIAQLQDVPKFIILSGYSEFTYVQKAIRYKVSHYLRKPIIEEEVDEVMQKIRQNIDQEIKQQYEEDFYKSIATSNTILKWIKGEVDEEMPQYLSQWLGIQEQSSFIIVLTELEMNETNSLSIEHIGEKLTADLSHDNHCALFFEKNNRFGLLLTDWDKGNYILEKHLIHFSERINDSEQCGISFYISLQGHGVEQINTLYSQAIEARTNKLITGKNGVFFYTPPTKDEMISTTLNIEITRLINLVKQGNTDAINDQIETTFMDHIGASYYDIMSYASILRAQLLAMIIEWDSAFDPSMLQVQSLMQPLDTHIATIKLDLARICIETSSLLQKLKHEKFGHHSLVKLVTYMEAHFNEKLHIQDLASQFHMTPSYLGQLFKQNIGMSFNDYLHHLRIEESKKLLRQTDMKIETIAKLVGYPNADYFVKKFKTVNDDLPSTYRKKNASMTKGGNRP